MMFDRILITGGCGFLGQWLVKNLLERYTDINIKIIDLKKSENPVFNYENEKRVEIVPNKDIRCLSSIIEEFRNIDAVFHLAGLVSFRLKDKKKLYSVHVEGTKNVLQAAQANNVKLFIHVSSVAALGYNNRKDEPIDETYSFDWDIADKRNKYYMLTKHLADLEVKTAISKGLDCIIVYPGLIYGPGDRGNPSKLIKAIKEERVPFNMSGGTNVIDVRDVSKGILSVLEKGRTKENYLLSGYNLTFKEINKIIAEKVKAKPPKRTPPHFLDLLLYYLSYIIELLSRGKIEFTSDNIDSASKFRYFDNSKARKELGWEPEIPFEKTVEAMLTEMQN